MSNKIKLGQEVQDRVTGFTGIVVSITDFTNGCKRIGVQAKWKTGEALLMAEMFDEPDLEVVSNGIYKEKEKVIPAHGDPLFKPSSHSLNRR